MSYADRVIETVKEKDPNQPEFIQAVTEVLESLKPVIDAHPEYERLGLLERIVEPERIIMFRVPWVDDQEQGPREPWLPRPVQQRHRTLQGRLCASIRL
jgi:hypothetical protein